MLLDVVIGVHIAAGMTATVAGAAAMFSPKRRGAHPGSGRVYLWALGVLVASAIAIVIARPHTAYLLILGGLALAVAGLGFTARRRRWRGWLRHHITAMAASYITMLTAFYVDNGPRLPLWELLPPITFWFLPAAVGLPLLMRALHHHPGPLRRQRTTLRGIEPGSPPRSGLG
jgi:uncharacterized membrane protein